MTIHDPLDERNYEALLHGKTLLCYYYLLKKRDPIGVRELQRALGFSSPSIAAHHLSKLVSWDLCRKRDDNKYELAQVVNFGVLKYFIITQNRFIPRFAFYFGFYFMILVGYVIVSFVSPSELFTTVILVFTLCSILLVFAYESWRTWKLLDVS